MHSLVGSGILERHPTRKTRRSLETQGRGEFGIGYLLMCVLCTASRDPQSDLCPLDDVRLFRFPAHVLRAPMDIPRSFEFMELRTVLTIGQLISGLTLPPSCWIRNCQSPHVDIMGSRMIASSSIVGFGECPSIQTSLRNPGSWDRSAGVLTRTYLVGLTAPGERKVSRRGGLWDQHSR